MSATFGTLLRQLRIAANLSQEALAEKASMSTAAIGAYERGIRSAPHRASVELLAEALSLTAESRREFFAAARPKGRALGEPGAGLPPGLESQSLPTETTSFVGREAEIAEISGLLGEHRVVTLTGTGGVGKTRVALRAASRQQRLHGVWFVDLGPITDPSRVIARILSIVPARSLGGEETPEALAESLRDREVLLVLDSCEHLIDIVGEIVAALVRAAPSVDVLVTSRHRLNISTEVVFRLAPLAYPSGAAVSASDARTYAAVALFESRASAADRRFTLTDDLVPEVTEICRRVEGIPLAVELAAARLPAFGLTALKERLHDRLGPLKGRVRDLPERQQALRATIDWSYDLLDEPEQLLLQRLAIFAGGCTLEAAEDVCAEFTLQRDWVADGLSSLVDRSLASADFTRNVPRFFLLESTRQYALEKVSETDRQSLNARHARWCASFADDVMLATQELSHAEWSMMVLPEMDNIYQAIDWSAKHDRLLYARIVGSLYFLWWRIGRLEEGRRLAVDALSGLDEHAHPRVAAHLHLSRSLSLSSAKKIEAAQRAIALLEGVGERRNLIEAYMHLGGGYLLSEDQDGVRVAIARASELVTQTGERNFTPLIAWLRGGLQLISGDYEGARRELLVALEAPNVRDKEAAYEIGYQLANVEHTLGNLEKAAKISEELVLSARRARMANHEMYTLVRASAFNLLLRNLDRAEASARDALLASRGLNSTILTTAIQLLATVAALRAEAKKAARLHGYVRSWFDREEHNHVGLPVACRELLETSLAERLSPEEIQHFMAVGAQMTEANAIAEALSGQS